MLENAQIESLLDNLANIIDKNDRLAQPMMVGIHTGGVWVAERLHGKLHLEEPLGSLDISFYRDDFSQIGLNPQVRSSDLPDSIEDRDVILVDDVLHTGRTIRAAMNELFDYGRPNSITLVVLIDRGGRELPVEAYASGMSIDLSENQQIKLYNDNGALSTQVIDTDAL